MIDKQLEEVFRWHPWPGPDPALKLVLEELDQSARQKVFVGLVDLQKDMLAAHTRFADTVHGAISAGPISAKKGGTGP